MQIMEKLLSGAIKFSSVKSAIDATSERRDSNIVILVSDQGLGVPSEFRESFLRSVSKSSRRIIACVAGLALAYPYEIPG